MDALRRGETNQHKSSKKKSRDQRKAIKASGSTDKTQEKLIGTQFESKPLDVLKKHIESSKEKSESSQLPNQPHKDIEELIQEKTAEKKSLDSAFADLRNHITQAKQQIEKIQKNTNLSRKDSVKQQIVVIQNYSSLNKLMLKNIKDIENEIEFLKQEKVRRDKLDLRFENQIERIKGLFKENDDFLKNNGIDLETSFKRAYPETPEILNIKSYYNAARKGNSLERKFSEEDKKFVRDLQANFLDNPIHKQYKEILQKRGQQRDWQERAKIIQNAKAKFEEVIHKETQDIHDAYIETLRAYHQDKNGPSALQILNDAYLQQLRHHRDPEKYCEVDKVDILNKFQEAWDSEEQLQRQFEEVEKRRSEVISSYVVQYCQKMHKMVVGPTDYGHVVSYYDFVEKNITDRLPNSLDELEKKSREALTFLEEEIKKLEFLHSQRPSELSKQPQKEMDQQSSAEKLQKHLETALKAADMADQRKRIVTSYMHGLFEKSHPQSLDDVTIAKFYQEAKYVGEYIEQRHFISDRIRDEAIQFAIHLKQTFGFPLCHATIDKDFNIVESRASESSSVSPPQLDIDRQGRILKDHRVQRVYLIGFQDSSEASSRHTQPKALLAIQSADTGYLKYGAGTPLPTGGVVDVITAQYTTREQPNLYKATLAIETFQETQNQKEVDIQTLEPFDTETVLLKSLETNTVRNSNRNNNNMTASYDVTTFVGKVKDRSSQTLPHDSKEYQETTGYCMVDVNKLISDANKDWENANKDREGPVPYRFSWHAQRDIKRNVARLALKDRVPTSDQGWQTNGERRWADFHEYSTSMNMFAKYLVLAYREKLGLASSK